jgi:sterol desaturase/sphingolipid hydroxylase (fatty acid hydroxylase superfamily)
VFGHTGFETLLVKNKKRLAIGHFHHQLHHRFFDCNYGSVDMPWDKWFGTFHDGSPNAMSRIRTSHKL